MGRVLGRVEFGQSLWRASVGIDLPQRLAVVRCIDNYVFRTPGTASAPGRICKNSHRTAYGRDFSELTVSEEGNELPVRRPEGKCGILCALKSCGDRVVQSLNI